LQSHRGNEYPYSFSPLKGGRGSYPSHATPDCECELLGIIAFIHRKGFPHISFVAYIYGDDDVVYGGTRVPETKLEYCRADIYGNIEF